MFSANKTARDLLVSILETDLPPQLDLLGLPPLRKVYRVEEGARPVYPNGFVPPVTGRVVSIGSGSMTSEVELYAIITVSVNSPETRDEQVEGYMTALMRCLYRDGNPRIEPVSFDTSPPAVVDRDQVQSVGVLVRVTVAEPLR